MVCILGIKAFLERAFLSNIGYLVILDVYIVPKIPAGCTGVYASFNAVFLRNIRVGETIKKVEVTKDGYMMGTICSAFDVTLDENISIDGTLSFQDFGSVPPKAITHTETETRFYFLTVCLVTVWFLILSLDKSHLKDS